MRRILALLLVSLLVCCLPFALAAAAEITAQGTAEISAKPDMFTIISNVSITEYCRQGSGRGIRGDCRRDEKAD